MSQNLEEKKYSPPLLLPKTAAIAANHAKEMRFYDTL